MRDEAMDMQESAAKLRRLGEDELSVDMVLPGDICDGHGEVLLHAGQTLAARDLTRLKELGPTEMYVGPEWSRPTALRGKDDDCDVETALRLRRATQRGRRVRRFKRSPWTTTLTISIEERGAEGPRTREVQVTTCDICPAGFAFYFPQFVHPGSILHVHCDFLPHKPVYTAIVRNCVHVDSRRHRIGAEFVRPDEVRERRREQSERRVAGPVPQVAAHGGALTDRRPGPGPSGGGPDTT